MDSSFNKLYGAIQWTRTSILILSILIFIISLSRYSRDTVPISSLNGDPHLLFKALIRDRQLISTLVAAQASIFCPIVLLAGMHPDEQKTLLDRFCQCMMPLGLGLGWVYCIFFDQKTANLLGQVSNPTIDGLKCLVILALAVEMGLNGLSCIVDKPKKALLLV